MHQSVQDGICNGLFTDYIIPAGHGQLDGKNGWRFTIPVFNYSHQAKLLLLFEMGQSKIIKDQQIGLCKVFKELEDGSFNARDFGFQQEFLHGVPDHNVA